MERAIEQRAIAILNEIMASELAGVALYTHSALMVRGPLRMPLVDFFKAQATESLAHAQAVGEIITGLDGHPSVRAAPIDDSGDHTVQSLVEESYRHEMSALELYKQLLGVVANQSVYLEEFARGMIGQEEQHTMELRKMRQSLDGS